MPRLPAICQNCHKIFAGVNVAGKNVTFINCATGPCPFCGHSTGIIPDGMYSALSDTLLEFISGRIQKAHIRTLIQVLTKAEEDKIDSQDLSDRIKEQVPQLSSITKVLPKTKGELYQFIMALVALLTFFVTTSQKTDVASSVVENDVDIIVNNTIENYYGANAPTPPSIEDPNKAPASQSSDNRKSNREQRKKKRHQSAKSRKRNQNK